MRYRYIHILAAFFLILGMGVQFFMSYYRARYYAKEIVDMKMEIAEGKLRFALHDAYDAVDQMKVIVEENLSSPLAIVKKLNDVLSDNNPSLTFVTAFVGRLHIPSGQLLYCNAAHLPPLVVSPNGDVKVMEMTPNIPLGYDAEYEFVEEGFTLGKDEKLVLCTDGVTEAVDASGKMMGEDVWRDIVAENGDLLEAVKHYIGAAEQVDDITIMSIHRMSEEQNETE